MAEAALDGTAFDETIVFLSHCKDLTDPRQQGKVACPLPEVLLFCLLAVLAGAETITDIALFGRKKLDLLRRFRPFANGTPAHDHLGDILAMLDPEQFQRCFVAWVAALIGTPEGVIATDGKTARRSGHKRKGQSPIPMVSAFAARQRLVLGQVKVAEKSNEIVAIPRLLALLAIEGAIITIDAMGCQRETAQTVDADHGRIETRDHHRHPPRRLAAATSRLARLERRLGSRQRAGNRRQERAGDPLLPHLPGAHGQHAGTNRAQPLGHREQPPLGSGPGVPRR